MDQLNVRYHTVWPAMAILLAVALLASPALASASSDALLAAAPSQSTCSYTVRAGNTLFSIAARYNTTVYNLTQLNVLNNPNRIYAGMMLRVPCNGVSNPPGPGDGSLPVGICSYYLVRPGENLRLIAARLQVTCQAIAQINHLYNSNLIYAGMRLAIPCGSGSGGDSGQWKTFRSTRYHYVVNYPASWTIAVQAPGPAAGGGKPEYVYLRPATTSLPMIEIYALKGAPPITGFEDCDKNLVFRGTLACSISLPRGQEPAQKLLVFQKGDSHYQMAIQYEAQQQLAVFEEVVKSFQFTP